MERYKWSNKLKTGYVQSVKRTNKEKKCFNVTSVENGFIQNVVESPKKKPMSWLKWVVGKSGIVQIVKNRYFLIF